MYLHRATYKFDLVCVWMLLCALKIIHFFFNLKKMSPLQVQGILYIWCNMIYIYIGNILKGFVTVPFALWLTYDNGLHMKSASLLWQLFSLAFEILIFLYFCTRIRRLALETKIEKFSDSLGKLRFFFNLKLSLDFWKTACFKHPLKKQKQNPKYLLCWELQVPYTRSCVSPRSSTFQGSHYWARRLEHPMACVSTLSLLLWDFVLSGK